MSILKQNLTQRINNQKITDLKNQPTYNERYENDINFHYRNSELEKIQ